MNRKVRAEQSTTGIKLRALLGVLALVFAFAIAAGSAGAANTFTLDGNAGGFGDVAVDAAGTGYFAWVHHTSSADTPMFCKAARGASGCANTQTLSLAGVPMPQYGPSAMFVLLPASPANTVYAVGPRYVTSDLLLWTSSDGGVSFGAPTVLTTQNFYTFAGPTDALLSGSNVFVASFNPDLHFASAPLGGPAPAKGSGDAAFQPPGGSLLGSALGLAAGSSGNPVLAYAVFNYGGGTPPQIGYYRNTGGDPNATANWAGPITVGPGQTPSLAGGPSGLFMLSEDFAPGTQPTSQSTPDRVDVRHYDSVSGTFGAPVTIETDPMPNTYGGRVFQTPGTGKLVVAFPGARNGDSQQTVQLFSSTDGGQTFAGPTNVGLGAAFVYPRDIRVAAADDGRGFVTFLTAGAAAGQPGLQVADFTPNPVPPPPPPPPPPPVPGPNSNFTVVATKVLPDGSLVLVLNSPETGTFTVTATVPSAQVSSATAAADSARKGCRKGFVRQKGRCLRKPPVVYGTGSLTVAGAKKVTLTIRPSATARRALARGRSLQLSVAVKFQSAKGGAPVTRFQSATVKLKKKKKGRR